MIASRARVAALALLLVASGVQADPAGSGDAANGLADDTPQQPVEATPGMPVHRQQGPIIVNTLGSLDGPAAGLLGAADGGLGNDMWSGSSRAEVEDLLSRIPLATTDAAIRALAKRLVLTQAEAPVGSGHRALIAIRVEKLLDAGLFDEAGALAAQVRLNDDADYARVQAEAILTAGRVSDACGDLTATRQSDGDLFWLQLRAYCAAIAGDSATAELTRNIIDAEGFTDAAFNILLDDVLNGTKTPPGPIAKPSAIHIFLLRKTGLPVGGDVAGVMGTSANLLTLRDARNSPEIRLAAAERIVRTGAASIAELKSVADAQPISAEQAADALNAAPKLPFFAGQVLLLRAATLESRPGVKAALVAAALSAGEKANRLVVAAGLEGEIAASLDVSVTPKESSGIIARALILSGRTDAAAHWLAGFDGASAQALLDLVAPNPSRDTQAKGALDVIAGRKPEDPQKALSGQVYDALLLGLFDALGRPVTPDVKEAATAAAATHWPGRRPDPDAMQHLMQASLQPERKGEAVLRILDIVGARGPGDLAPDVTVELVRTLKQLGLPDAAQALAVEALLLYSPPQ